MKIVKMPEKQICSVDDNFKLEEQFVLRVPEVNGSGIYPKRCVN